MNENGSSPTRWVVALEVTGALLTVGVLVWVLREPLLRGRSTFVHDVLYWSFPIYHFLAENLLQGRLPYWNPFSHAGEPFYPILLQLRLLEPVTFLSLFVGRIFTDDLLILFNWDRMGRGLVAAFGTYLLLRQWTTHWLVRVSLLPVVLWSSFLLTSFRQTGTVDVFISAPYVAYFLFRIVESGGRGWGNWIALALGIGLAWQSYYFVSVWAFLLFAILGLAAFRRSRLRELLRAPGLLRRLVPTAAVVTLMALPNLVVLLERDHYVFPARVVDHSYANRPPVGGPLQYEPGPAVEPDTSIVMPYGLVRYSGTFGSIWDFVQLISPDGNRAVRGPRDPAVFGRPSEAFMYLGLIVYAGALLGLIAGCHQDKRVWLVIAAGFGLLFLGPAGGLHGLLYRAYPPLWFMRHTHLFVNFFVLALLYFYVLGANRFVEWRSRRLFEDERQSRFRPRVPLGATARSVVFVVFVAVSWVVGLTIVSGGDSTLVLGLLLGATLAAALRSILGGAWVFWGVLLAHALLVLTFAPLPIVFLSRLAIFFGIPVGLLVLARVVRPSFFRPLLPLLVVFLALDLLEYLQASALLWAGPRPDQVSAIAARPSAPVFPVARRVALSSKGLGLEEEQSIRYLELAARTPSAFSTVKRAPTAGDAPPPGSVADVIGAQRWNSFLMLRGYYDLIHSGAPAPVLEHVLAIDRPLIQFRTRALPAPAGGFAAAIRGPDGATDFGETVVLHDAPPVPLPSAAASPGGPAFRFGVIRYDYNSLDLQVEAPVAGFLYYADGYDSHWKAAVDDRPAPVIRANGNFKAIPVGAGPHIVRLTYDPIPFRAAVYVFLGTTLTASTILALGPARRALQPGLAQTSSRLRQKSTTPTAVRPS